MSGVLKRLDDIGQTLVRLASELKQCVEDVRVVNARQLERLEQERASALLAASVDAHVEAEQVSLHNVDETEAKKVSVILSFLKPLCLLTSGINGFFQCFVLLS